MKTRWVLFFGALLCWTTHAIDSQLNWRYQLLEGSFSADDCLLCGRPTINIPMRGSFMLRRIAATPQATRYVIENASFKAGDSYSFTGSGTYETTGDFVIRQTMTLVGDLTTPSGTKNSTFTNQSSTITRRWPMLAATLTQTNGTLASTITLTIAAAPLQEIWFSTATNFTRAIKVDNEVSDGDLLSSAGRIVKSNGDLQNFPGPTYANIGLDAVDLLPGGVIAFSGYAKGVLNDGDYAYSPSGLIFRWQDFMPILSPTLASDPGLDALNFVAPDNFYFSTKQDFDSFGHGDILTVNTTAGTGGLFKKNADLLVQFHPAEVKDYGLDALYIWPSGEIWFSTTNDFSDSVLGTVTAGDLLSDAGYIVYRNADLTAALQPVGTSPTDFGLDAVAVISDAVVDDGATTIKAVWDSANKGVIVSWKGGGRVFQLERASDVAGPWSAITPIIPDLQFEDFDAAGAQQNSFYRLRQW